MSLSQADRSIIADLLAHYADGERQVSDRFGLELEEIEEIALDEGLERCSECGWWDEAGVLVEDDGTGYRHTDC